MLHKLDDIPDGLLDCEAHELLSVIPSATLLKLEGKRKQPLFMSVLLHGNETTGWIVARNILRKYKDAGLPRSLHLFIGNVTAANEKKRRLDGQPDYNRIWIPGDSMEHRMTGAILREMQQADLFASVDIHNNTGINPHYACINRLDYAFINLARKFSRTIIYFVRPSGVQSKAFARLCPAVTLECGQAGDEYGIQLATGMVDSLLNSAAIDTDPVHDSEIDLFHTTAVIKVPDNISLSFDDSAADIRFIRGIESLNFEEIPPGTRLASMAQGLDESLHVQDEDGKEVAGQLLTIEDGFLVNKKPLMPSMLTRDEKIIRQDCLCYVQERYAIAMGEKDADDDLPVWTPEE